MMLIIPAAGPTTLAPRLSFMPPPARHRPEHARRSPRIAASVTRQPALPATVQFKARQLPVPFAIACAAALAAAASATHGASTAACAFLLLAFMSNKASKRALPPPDDILELAAPKCFLGEGSSSAPFKDGDKTVHPKQLSEAIQRVMRAQLQAGTQVGMQVSVYYKGRQVANVCGGVYRSMSEGGDTWKAVDPSTLFMSYSVCKGVAAAGLMTCVDRGECKYEDRVSEKWSAFAQGDKDAVSIADAVSHRAGMPGITMRFLPVVAAHLAAAARGWQSAWCAGTAFIEKYRPEWAPGTCALYHYVSFSWIIGGIVERVSGLHIHRLVLDRVAAPLNQQGNMYVGLLPGSEQDRAARLEVPHAYTPLPAGWGSPDELASDAEEQAGGSSALESQEHAPGSAGALLRKRVFGWIESSIFVGAGNSWAWRQVCLPSSNGFFTAGALGCMYGALSNRGALSAGAPGERQGQRRLVSADTVAQVVASWGDAVPTRGATRPGKSALARRALGFSPWLDERVSPDADKVCTLSHFGMGSCIALGEVETGLAMAVLKNSYEPVALVGGSLSPDVHELVRVIRANLPAA